MMNPAYQALSDYSSLGTTGAPPGPGLTNTDTLTTPPGTSAYGIASAYAAAAAAAAAYDMSDQQIRTVFVTGFPPDVKDREFHNMLRFLPGFEASQMNWKNGPPQGFALFSTAAAARNAVEQLSQVPFDDDCKLRCEMAHKNMYLKEGDPTIRRLYRPQSAMTPVLHTPSAAAAFQAVTGYMTPYAAAGMASGIGGLGLGSSRLATPLQSPLTGFAPVSNKGDNQPCNTLFVGNLSDTVSEAELVTLFGSQPGYRQLKLVRGPKQVSCFVEYDDVLSASSVHNGLQGACLASSDRGGIRIQYSKNPFGRRSPPGPGALTGGGLLTPDIWPPHYQLG